jgi:hypothetical protein
MVHFVEFKPNTYMARESREMPRRSATTTDTLEQQAAADSEIELEPTPFDSFTMPSREQLLDDLDARDDAVKQARTRTGGLK